MKMGGNPAQVEQSFGVSDVGEWLFKCQMAETFGWTFTQVDDMTDIEIAAAIAYLNAKAQLSHDRK